MNNYEYVKTKIGSKYIDNISKMAIFIALLMSLYGTLAITMGFGNPIVNVLLIFGGLSVFCFAIYKKYQK